MKLTKKDLEEVAVLASKIAELSETEEGAAIVKASPLLADFVGNLVGPFLRKMGDYYTERNIICIGRYQKEAGLSLEQAYTLCRIQNEQSVSALQSVREAIKGK